MSTMPARIVHVTIEKPWEAVFAFAHAPANMPLWASGLASGLTRDGDSWLADGGPIGQVRVRFSEANEFGILDHTVTMEDGTVVANPLRVVANGTGAEVMFTLFRRSDQDLNAFEADAAHVLKDLNTLKSLMESNV